MGEQDTVVEEIAIGRYDDQLNTLFQAILHRIEQGVTTTEWVIEDAAGVTLRETEMTVGVAERAEKLSGVSWADLNPVRSAMQFRAVVQAELERSGVKDAEARRRVQDLKAADAVRCVRTELVEPVPFDTDPQPTTS